MKSVRKIFAKLEDAGDFTAAVHKLGNGDLRTLLLYMTRKRPNPDTATGELILANAICAAATRFVKAKGKGLFA